MNYTYGNRTESPGWFDMANRFRPTSHRWYGTGFRIGDRAAAYIYLHLWRNDWPKRRMIIYEDNTLAGTEHSRHFPGTWMFPKIADELIVVDNTERLTMPKGDRLYYDSLWKLWSGFRSRCHFKPDIEPTTESQLKAAGVLKDVGLTGEDYVTVQPLFDAPYNKHRNAPPYWWRLLCEQLIKEGFKVLVVGPQEMRKTFRVAKGSCTALPYACNPMDSLALIHKAKAHFGGETGITLWAAIMQVPVVAFYRVKDWNGTGPISFGAPTLRFNIGGPVETPVKMLKVGLGLEV